MLLGTYIKAHHLSRAALCAGGVAAAILFFAVGAAIRLMIGPVSLGPLGDTLPNAIASALPGISVRYDRAAIEWSRDQGRVNLVILGAKVFDAGGRIIAQAPEADIDLAAGPLLHGKTVVRRITLVGVQLALVRTRSGGLRLGVEKDKNESDILNRISDAITMRSDKASSLQEFAIRKARLAFFDETTGLFLVAPRADFHVATAGPNLNASLDADLEIAGRPAHIVGEFTLPPNKGPVKGEIALRGIDLRALGSDAKGLAAVKRLNLVLDLSASFTMRGAHLLSADFGLGAKGSIAIPGLKKGPLKVDAAQLVARYDGASGRLLIDDGSLNAGGAKAHLSGHCDIGRNERGALERIGFDLAVDKIALAMPGVLAGPIALRLIEARGSYDAASRAIIVDHAEVSGGPLSAHAQGRLTLVPGLAPAVELRGQMAGLRLRELLRYWPLGVGAGARQWIDANMTAGSLGIVSFEAHMPAGMLDADVLAENALKVTVPMSGVEANYLTGLTHLTQLSGVATLTGDTFRADISSGRVGPLQVSRGQVVIANLHIPEAPGDFTAHMSGAMPDMLSLLNMKPLQYPDRFGIDPADTQGATNVDLSFHLPMRKNLSVSDVGIAVKATASALSIPLGERARLTDGTANFDISNSKLHATGSAQLADSRLTFDWTEEFGNAKPVTTHIAVKGPLGAGARAALNFQSGSFLKGPAIVSGTLTGRRGALLTADMNMDLGPSVLEVDLIGLDKPAGYPATAHVSATFGPDSVIRAETVKIAGPGIAANGTATFDEGGKLAALSLPAVRFGSANDFNLSLTRGPSGEEIAVRGHSLDGSKLAGHGGAGGAAGDETTLRGPYRASIRLDRLVLRDGVTVSPFSLDVAGVGDRPSSLSLSGSLSKSANVTAAIAPGANGRRLTFATNDAGLLAKGLFGFASLRGGAIELAATFPARTDKSDLKTNAPDYWGKLSIRDFKVLNQPFLTRLFSAGSLDGLINLMQGEGIAVDKFDIPFSSRGGVVDIKGARATGPAIGLTADGYIDRPKDAIALKGTLVPLFGINSVLGAIPLLGDVLVSKKGEGVFGMTYSISGNADRPNVGVNPLSVLTPGIFRRIFEGRMPNSAQAPSNQKPSAPATPPAPPKT